MLEGLAEIEKYPQVSPIKINAVAIRGFSEPEVLEFARLARRTPYEVRWIEYMPLDADQTWTKDDVLTGAEIKALIEQEYPLVGGRGPRPQFHLARLPLRRWRAGHGWLHQSRSASRSAPSATAFA